jgi:hypothetical protein
VGVEFEEDTFVDITNAHKVNLPRKSRNVVLIVSSGLLFCVALIIYLWALQSTEPKIPAIQQVNISDGLPIPVKNAIKNNQ